MDNKLIERRIEQLLEDTERTEYNIELLTNKLENTKLEYEFNINEATMEIKLKTLDLEIKKKELASYTKQGFRDFIARKRSPEY